jgi:adenylate cyclase
MSDQGVAQLMAMLRERNLAHPAEWTAMDACISERFRATRAVMFTDLSGFSKTTADQGIVTFLARIERVLHICLPIVESHAGRLIKTIGDDLMCDFRSAESAVQAAADMQDALASETFAHDDTIKMGVGIGFGEVLDIDGEDLYGDEVNRASKLGEDLSEPGEILVTSAVVHAVQEVPGYKFEPRRADELDLKFPYAALIPN